MIQLNKVKTICESCIKVIVTLLNSTIKNNNIIYYLPKGILPYRIHGKYYGCKTMKKLEYLV